MFHKETKETQMLEDIKTPSGLGKALDGVLGVGYQVFQFAVDGVGFVGHLLDPVKRLSLRLFETCVLGPFQVLKKEFLHVREDLKIARARLKEKSGAGVKDVTKELVTMTGHGVKKHKSFFVRVTNYIVPVAAVGVFMITLSVWSNMSFALAVEYNGQELCYVQNESVFDQAADMAAARVIDENHEFSINRTPTFTMKIVNNANISGVDEVCDDLISKSDIAVRNAFGVYVDGKFLAAVEDQQQINELLQSYLDQYKTGAEGESVAFINDVSIREGLYPDGSINTIDALNEKLTAKQTVEKYYTVVEGDVPSGISKKFNMKYSELKAMNPDMTEMIHPGDQIMVAKAETLLGVKLVKNVTYNKDIDYDTKKLTDSRKDVGYSTVKTKGEKGVQQYVDQVTYIDGVETERSNLSKTVLKEAVTEEIIVGSKKAVKALASASKTSYTNSTQKSTGEFMWPVNGGYVSSGYGYRGRSFHKGLDIAAPKGTSIYAADAGVVIAAGYDGSYGLCVRIRHDNGIVTRYGHQSQLNSTVGQRVSKGQVIGYVGSTGRSTGNHCHFEVIVNGSVQNPYHYLG